MFKTQGKMNILLKIICLSLISPLQGLLLTLDLENTSPQHSR